MTKYLTAYGIALVIFVAIDALWLGVIARNLYQSKIGDILLDNPRFGVAVIFYLLFLAGLVYFGIAAGFGPGGARSAAINGALYGFFTYMTYTLTNLATLKGYSDSLAVIDTAWGVFLGGAVSFLTIQAMSYFGLLAGD